MTAEHRPDFWSERFETCATEVNRRRFGGTNFLMNPGAGAALVEILPQYLAANG